MTDELTTVREAVAELILTCGALAINLDKGFELSVHQEQHPEAPRSPFYLNLRPVGTQKQGLQGTLQNDDYPLLVDALIAVGERGDLFAQRRAIVGIPDAATPLATQFAERFAQRALGFLDLVTMQKTTSAGTRTFCVNPHRSRIQRDAWGRTLLVDDLVSSASNKELAVRAIENAGGKATDLLVLIDRSGGGARTQLAAHGITLHAVWEFEDLLKWGLDRRHLTQDEFDAIVEYPGRLAAYLRTAALAPVT